MDPLVQKLLKKSHVEIDVRPEKSAKALKRCIDSGYVHVKFTETRGGTVLGVKVDPASSDITSGNFEVATGRVRLAGQLTLNYERVNCIADINLETLDGEGYLEPVPAPVAEA